MKGSKPMSQFLGRLPSRLDPRTLRLEKYIQLRELTFPDACRWEKNVQRWGVGGNNQYGNCVIVTSAHMLLNWRAAELGDTRPISDDAIIELSRTMGALDGFNILERLKYWRKSGMWADILWAYVAINTADDAQIKIAVSVFGGADIGINLPSAWQNAKRWDIGTGRTYRPGSWGGHSVPIVGYDTENLYVVTWGEIMPMSWAALKEYVDEGYALINSNWLAKNGRTPNGFNLESLVADLRALSN